MNILTKKLERYKIAEFIATPEGQKAFENLQRDMINLWPQSSFVDADSANATASLIDSTLTVGLESNATYIIEADLTFQSSSLTNGIAIALKLPVGATISGYFQHNVTNNTLGGGFNSASSTFSSATSGVPIINENIPLVGKWVVKNGANQGNATLQFASEVGGQTVTLKEGLCNLNAYQTR